MNKVDSLRQAMVQYLMCYVGTPYRWGGDDFSGFDCSGLAVEGLKSVGLISRGEDYTAHGLMKKFSDCNIFAPVAGALLFHINGAGVATHVEVCISQYQTIGASGGGSGTLTVADAIRQNAFIKVRPISGENFFDPFQKIC